YSLPVSAGIGGELLRQQRAPGVFSVRSLQGLSQSNLSRISQTDPAQAQYIDPSIVNSCARGNEQANECPRPDWRACITLSVATCVDELETKAFPLRPFAGSFARTTLL